MKVFLDPRATGVFCRLLWVVCHRACPGREELSLPPGHGGLGNGSIGLGESMHREGRKMILDKRTILNSVASPLNTFIRRSAASVVVTLLTSALGTPLAAEHNGKCDCVGCC